MNRLRLDRLLHERGLYDSRARARDAIVRGTVTVNGAVIAKPGQTVATDAEISIDDAAQRYVSRAALKLKHGLEHFAIDVAGRTAVDIGASTGGFVQVLLEAGAQHVYGVDVGHGQLAESLRDDPRVTSLENLNARDLTAAHLPEPFRIVTSDVSFISLKLALPPVLALAEPGSWLVALIKPQFEAGRDALGKGGVVRNEAVHRQVCGDIAQWLQFEQHWTPLPVTASPIAGGEGNREFIIAAQKP